MVEENGLQKHNRLVKEAKALGLPTAGLGNDELEAAIAAAPEPEPALPRLLAITIDNGETWDDVAARADCDPDALFEANRGIVGSNRDRALPGTPLEVPQED